MIDISDLEEKENYETVIKASVNLYAEQIPNFVNGLHEIDESLITQEIQNRLDDFKSSLESKNYSFDSSIQSVSCSFEKIENGKKLTVELSLDELPESLFNDFDKEKRNKLLDEYEDVLKSDFLEKLNSSLGENLSFNIEEIESSYEYLEFAEFATPIIENRKTKFNETIENAGFTLSEYENNEDYRNFEIEGYVDVKNVLETISCESDLNDFNEKIQEMSDNYDAEEEAELYIKSDLLGKRGVPSSLKELLLIESETEEKLGKIASSIQKTQWKLDFEEKCYTRYLNNWLYENKMEFISDAISKNSAPAFFNEFLTNEYKNADSMIEILNESDFREWLKETKFGIEKVEAFPKWAIHYLEYGDESGELTEDEKKLADNWAKENNFAFWEDTEKESYFSSQPEFGLPSEVVDVVFTSKEFNRVLKEFENKKKIAELRKEYPKLSDSGKKYLKDNLSEKKEDTLGNALLESAFDRNISVVKEMLELGANPCYQDYETGNNFIHELIDGGHGEKLEEIISLIEKDDLTEILSQKNLYNNETPKKLAERRFDEMKKVGLTIDSFKNAISTINNVEKIWDSENLLNEIIKKGIETLKSNNYNYDQIDGEVFAGENERIDFNREKVDNADRFQIAANLVNYMQSEGFDQQYINETLGINDTEQEFFTNYPGNIENKIFSLDDFVNSKSLEELIKISEDENSKFLSEKELTDSDFIEEPSKKMSLAEILNQMEFTLEEKDGKYQVFDYQRGEYLDNGEDDKGNVNSDFENAEEIIDRMEIYMNDYWLTELNETLSEIDGFESESWEDIYNSAIKFKDKFNFDDFKGDLEVLDLLLNPEKLEDFLPKDKRIEKLWESLENVAFDENEESELILSEDWNNFKKGTTRTEIWKWFDENHTKGVDYLLYDYESDESNKKSISQRIETAKNYLANVSKNLERNDENLLIANDLALLLRENDKENNLSNSIRPTGEQILTMLDDGWGIDEAVTGYIQGTSDDLPKDTIVIMKIDAGDVFYSDLDAAKQAEKDGVKLISENEIINEYPFNAYRFIDTERNREILRENGYLKSFKSLENVSTFENDREKMTDFFILDKNDFLESYSYLTEEEYDATSKLVDKKYLIEEKVLNLSLESIFNSKLTEEDIKNGTDTVVLSNGHRIERDGDKRNFDLYSEDDILLLKNNDVLTKFAEIGDISYFKVGVDVLSLDSKEVEIGLEKSKNIENLTEQLVVSFDSLDYQPELWEFLIKSGADPKQALYPASCDAYLGDNLRWLIENISEEKWNEIKEDRNFCKEIFENARDSIMNDHEFSVNPMLELAEKIEMLPEAISYCKELEKEYGADYEKAKNLKENYGKYEEIVYQKKLLNKLSDFVSETTKNAGNMEFFALRESEIFNEEREMNDDFYEQPLVGDKLKEIINTIKDGKTDSIVANRFNIEILKRFEEYLKTGGKEIDNFLTDRPIPREEFNDKTKSDDENEFDFVAQPLNLDILRDILSDTRESLEQKFEKTKYDFDSLADKLIQTGLENSTETNYQITFKEIAKIANKDEEWVKENIKNIRNSLSSHNDNELLDYPYDTKNEDNEKIIDLNYCSLDDDEMSLFRKENGRWVRKSEEEIDLYYDIEERLSEDFYNHSLSEITDVKIYNPENYGFEKDDKIHVLVEFEGSAREDDIFNLLHDEENPFTYFGKEVDCNPINIEKSGTVEQYLENLKKLSNEKEFTELSFMESLTSDYSELTKYLNENKPKYMADFTNEEVKDMFVYLAGDEVILTDSGLVRYSQDGKSKVNSGISDFLEFAIDNANDAMNNAKTVNDSNSVIENEKSYKHFENRLKEYNNCVQTEKILEVAKSKLEYTFDWREFEANNGFEKLKNLPVPNKDDVEFLYNTLHYGENGSSECNFVLRNLVSEREADNLVYDLELNNNFATFDYEEVQNMTFEEFKKNAESEIIEAELSAIQGLTKYVQENGLVFNNSKIHGFDSVVIEKTNEHMERGSSLYTDYSVHLSNGLAKCLNYPLQKDEEAVLTMEFKENEDGTYSKGNYWLQTHDTKTNEWSLQQNFNGNFANGEPINYKFAQLIEPLIEKECLKELELEKENSQSQEIWGNLKSLNDTIQTKLIENLWQKGDVELRETWTEELKNRGEETYPLPKIDIEWAKEKFKNWEVSKSDLEEVNEKTNEKDNSLYMVCVNFEGIEERNYIYTGEQLKERDLESYNEASKNPSDWNYGKSYASNITSSVKKVENLDELKEFLNGNYSIIAHEESIANDIGFYADENGEPMQEWNYSFDYGDYMADKYSYQSPNFPIEDYVKDVQKVIDSFYDSELSDLYTRRNEIANSYDEKSAIKEIFEEIQKEKAEKNEELTFVNPQADEIFKVKKLAPNQYEYTYEVEGEISDTDVVELKHDYTLFNAAELISYDELGIILKDNFELQENGIQEKLEKTEFHSLDYSKDEDVDRLYKWFNYFVPENLKIDSFEKAKILLSYATDFNDGDYKFAINEKNEIYLNTNADSEGWKKTTLTDFVKTALNNSYSLLEDGYASSEEKDFIQEFDEKWTTRNQNESLGNSIDTTKDFYEFFKDVGSLGYLKAKINEARDECEENGIDNDDDTVLPVAIQNMIDGEIPIEDTQLIEDIANDILNGRYKDFADVLENYKENYKEFYEELQDSNELDELYSPLSKEALMKFINIEGIDSFTEKMAEHCLGIYENQNVPLVTDELGNVYQREMSKDLATGTDEDLTMLTPSGLINFYRSELEREREDMESFIEPDDYWMEKGLNNKIAYLDNLEESLTKIEERQNISDFSDYYYKVAKNILLAVADHGYADAKIVQKELGLTDSQMKDLLKDSNEDFNVTWDKKEIERLKTVGENLVGNYLKDNGFDDDVSHPKFFENYEPSKYILADLKMTFES